MFTESQLRTAIRMALRDVIEHYGFIDANVISNERNISNGKFTVFFKGPALKEVVRALRRRLNLSQDVVIIFGSALQIPEAEFEDRLFRYNYSVLIKK